MKPKVGRNFTSERGEGVKGEVKNISLHWLQGIFETVPNVMCRDVGSKQKGGIAFTSEVLQELFSLNSDEHDIN